MYHIVQIRRKISTVHLLFKNITSKPLTPQKEMRVPLLYVRYPLSIFGMDGGYFLKFYLEKMQILTNCVSACIP